MKQITIVIILWLILIVAALAGQTIKTTSGQTTLTVVEFDYFAGKIKISPNMDFINIKVEFTDLPGQSITVKELRDLIKSKPVMK